MSSTPRVAAPAGPMRVPLPRVWSHRTSDVTALLVVNAVIVMLMWARHAGFTISDPVMAGGQITALLGTYLALVGLLLASRAPWLDQVVGPEALLRAHRWIGFATVTLLLAHSILSTVAFAGNKVEAFGSELVALVDTVPGMLGAVVGMGLFILVAASSMRMARRRVSYETWHSIHLYAYLALAFAFLHQLTIGSDFVSDPIAQGYWVVLYIVALAPLAIYRWIAPVAGFARHRFLVTSVVPETNGIVSVYIGGRNLDQLPVRAGQWFRLRFLTRDGWWAAHPFSISAAPNGNWLRFTVKTLGDRTSTLGELAIGTRVILEGPYGTLHGGLRRHAKVLLLAGGIGITPLRALLEALPAKAGQITLLYRVRSEAEIVHRAELDELAARRGAIVRYIIGSRVVGGTDPDPFSAKGLLRLVPDVTERDVFLCGSESLMHAATSSLHELGVPNAHIHLERFAW